MPEIDLRKLHEMQLAQNQNHEIEENSSHNTPAHSGGVEHGIVDLGVSLPVAPTSSPEAISSPKIIKKDVWIDTPHERVIETPQGTGTTKAKPIKISLSSLSQHQKQKDPERLYQEKEAEIGKLFSGNDTVHEDPVNIVGDSLPSSQESSQETQSSVITIAQNVPETQVFNDTLMNVSDHTESEAESQKVATLIPHPESQSIESVIVEDTVLPVAHTPVSQGENITSQPLEQQEEQKESSIEDVSQNSIQGPQDGTSSPTGVASNQVGFFPELSFITPVSIPKENDIIPQDTSLPLDPQEVTSDIPDITVSGEITPLHVEESEQAGVIPDNNRDDTGVSDPAKETPAIGAGEMEPNMESSADSTISISTEAPETPVEIIPPNEVSSQESSESLHETNKKSLRWVISGVMVMILTLGGAGVYFWQNQQHDVASSPSHGGQDNRIVSITDLPKNTSSGSTSTGIVLTGNTLTGSTMTDTGSFSSTGSTGTGLIVGTGVINTSSGSLSFSGKTSGTGVTLSGSLTQSVGVKLPSGTGSLAVANTGSTIANTSTGKVSSATGSIVQKPNMSTGSIVAPSITTVKYLEGRDYRVYGGGYKLIRTTKKK